MFKVYYFPDPDYGEDLTPGDWDAGTLFIDPDDDGYGPAEGDQVIAVSYSGEGWLTIQYDMEFKKWPYEVPAKFWQRVIKGIFSGDL